MNVSAWLRVVSIALLPLGCMGVEASESDAITNSDASETGTTRQFLGKKCEVVYEVIATIPDQWCPDTIVGHGLTKFLGGCGKCYRFAQEDAENELGPGCALGSTLSEECKGR